MAQQKDGKTFWTPMRLVSTMLVLGLIVLFGASSCNSNDPTPTAPTTPTGQTTNPPRSTTGVSTARIPAVALEAKLKTTNGSSIKLADYSGKVMLVNLWATWCGPCRLETPELVKLHKEFGSRGVEIFGLSTEDPEASDQAVRQFIQAHNVDYHVGWAPPEVSLSLMQGNTSIPQSFIITRDGRILKRFIGFSQATTPPQLRQALEDALAGKG